MLQSLLLIFPYNLVWSWYFNLSCQLFVNYISLCHSLPLSLSLLSLTLQTIMWNLRILDIHFNCLASVLCSSCLFVALQTLLTRKTLIYIYSAFIKGDHTYFDIESSRGVEGTELYPHLRYTTTNEHLDTVLEIFIFVSATWTHVRILSFKVLPKFFNHWMRYQIESIKKIVTLACTGRCSLTVVIVDGEAAGCCSLCLDTNGKELVFTCSQDCKSCSCQWAWYLDWRILLPVVSFYPCCNWSFFFFLNNLKPNETNPQNIEWSCELILLWLLKIDLFKLDNSIEPLIIGNNRSSLQMILLLQYFNLVSLSSFKGFFYSHRRSQSQ